MLGVAWPAMRADFDAPLAGLGVLLIAFTATYFWTTALTGVLMRRLGVRILSVASAVTAAIGLAIQTGAAEWWHVVVASLVLGAGSGTLDAGLNAHVALGRRVSSLGLLHAAWATGAALGPVLVSAGGTGSWRGAYAVATLAFVLVGLALVAVREHPPAMPEPARGGGRVSLSIFLGTIALFLYVGLEVAAGQWAYTDLAERRALSGSLSATGVSLYWSALALGRFVLGVTGDRLPPRVTLDLSVALSLVAALAFALLPPTLAALVSLPLLGAALSVFVPLVFFFMPERVGRARTATAIGFLSAGGTIGGAFIPAAIGVGIQAFDVSVLGWCLVLVALALGAVHLAARNT